MMEWTCPHCQTQLAAPGATSAAPFTYVRCAKCNGYAMVERATGKSTQVGERIAPRTSGSTPPPFKPQPAPADPIFISAPIITAPQAPEYFASKPRISPIISGIIVAGGAIAMSLSAGNYLSTQLKPKAHVASAEITEANNQRASAAAIRIAALAPAPAPDLLDTIRSAAMAPIRPEAPQPIKLYLQARAGVKALKLRSGPGDEHTLVGMAKLEEQYPVLEWRNHWFKVSLDDHDSRKTAWVQYDGVEILSDDGQIGAQQQ